MENTNSNRLKFFGLYLGQKIFMVSHDALVNQNCSPWFLYRYADTGVLNLKPLSEITDADASELGRICDFHECTKQNGRTVFDFLLDKESAFISNNVYHLDYVSVFDFLRSKGYALPFNGLSVEKLIEYGWLKLSKTN